MSSVKELLIWCRQCPNVYPHRGIASAVSAVQSIAQIKRINDLGVIFTNQHRSHWRLLAGARASTTCGMVREKETRMLRGSFFL